LSEKRRKIPAWPAGIAEAILQKQPACFEKWRPVGNLEIMIYKVRFNAQQYEKIKYAEKKRTDHR
jgi:hypothetical protein